MAAGTDFSPPFTVLEGGNNKDNASITKDEICENSDDLKKMTNGKPPRHLSVVRHSIGSATITGAVDLESDYGVLGIKSPTDAKPDFLPVLRSGSCAEKGPKQYMEDEHICIDNLVEHLGASATAGFPSPGAFYGGKNHNSDVRGGTQRPFHSTLLETFVKKECLAMAGQPYEVPSGPRVFDGHGGIDAASFIRKNILKFVVEDSHFPVCLEKAIKNAFVKADHAFADDSSLDISSGTTAIAALIFGRMMVVANAGDCRAVLGKRGRAVELSEDHKPNCTSERARIEKLGGAIYDGYLNGQLSVSRALGDWHMKRSKGSACPLIAEPELQETVLVEEDEFMIIGCDGLWDVMSSQCAVTTARKELMLHNDPERCSRELVREALKRHTCDNLTVIIVCFSPDPPPQIEIPQTRVRRSISTEGLNLLKGVLDSNS